MEINKYDHLTRQMDLIPLKILNKPINIIGAGAVGSFTTLALAKMGFTNITVFDDDKIDIENMNCQFFRFKDIGKHKTEALQELVEDFTNTKINIVTDRWSGAELPGIVISAVDNMETRAKVWDAHRGCAIDTDIIVDPRMSAEKALMFMARPLSKEDNEWYKLTLYSDDDAVQERCTAKSTMYTVLGLSSVVANNIKNFLVDDKYSHSISWDIKADEIMSGRK